MGRVKQLYQELLDHRTIYGSVPAEYTMSSFELEELEFLSAVDLINAELQIISNSDQDEKEIA